MIGTLGAGSYLLQIYVDLTRHQLRKLSRYFSTLERHKLALAIGVVARGWIQLITFAMFAVAAHYLGLDDFGRFTLAMVFVNIVQAYLYSGVYEFILKADPADRLDRMLLASNFGFSIIGALLSSAAGILIGYATGDAAIGVLAMILAPSALLAGINSACEAMVLRSQGYRFYNLTWVVAETAGCIVAVAMLVSGWGILSLIAYRYVQAILGLLGFVVFGRVRFNGEIRREEFTRIMRFAGPIYVSRIVGTVSEYGADLVIGLLVSPAAAGIYRLASRIVSGLTEVILQPLRVVSWARSSRVGRHPARIAFTILQVLQLCAIALLPMVVIVGFAAGPAIAIGLGPQWASAAFVVFVLMMARAISVFELILEPLLVGLGRNRLLLVTRLLSVAVLFVMLAVAAGHGVQYIGFARVGSTAVGAGVAFYILCTILGFGRTVHSLRPGALLALVSFAVLLPISLWLPPSGIIGMGGRIAALFLLGVAIAVTIAKSRRRIKIAPVRNDRQRSAAGGDILVPTTSDI